MLTRLVGRDSLSSSAGHKTSPLYRVFTVMLCSRFIGHLMMFLYEYEVFLLLSDNETCTIGHEFLSAEKVVAALT